MTASILLVEDDDTARTLLTNILTRTGYQVTPAPDGETAVSFLYRTTPGVEPPPEQLYDVVITDIRMRELDGIAVMQAAMEQTPPPAVILMTGYSSVETAIAALRGHAYDYLLKPCDTSDLLECVAGAIQHRTANIQRNDAITLLSKCVNQLQEANILDTRTPSPAKHTTPEPPLPERTERFARVGSLVLDLFRHTATFQEQPLQLTPIEYALLRSLAETPGRVHRYQDIAMQTHGTPMSNNEAQVLLRAHVHNLRRKITPSYLVNVRGTGYMLVNPEE